MVTLWKTNLSPSPKFLVAQKQHKAPSFTESRLCKSVPSMIRIYVYGLLIANHRIPAVETD